MNFSQNSTTKNAQQKDHTWFQIMLIHLFQLLAAPILLFVFLWSLATARPDSHAEKCLIIPSSSPELKE